MGGLFISLGYGALAESFRDPVSVPPTGVTSLPLTSGLAPAIKVGALTVQGNVTVDPDRVLTVGVPAGTTSKLCLNPLNATSTAYCVKSWGDISIGPFLVLNEITPGETHLNYYASLQAGADQEYAIAGESAPSGDTSLYGVAGIVPNTDNPLAAGIFGNVPGASAQDGEAWAAIFNGNGDGTGDSGQVAVRVLDADDSSTTTTDRRLTVGTTAGPTSLCLYGDGSQNCISRWEQIGRYANADANFLLLQQVTPSVAQVGSIGTKGNVRFGSVVVGTPGANAGCGDGICTIASETSSSCEVDCASVSSGPTFEAATKVVSWTTSTPTTTELNYGKSSNVYSGSIGTSTVLTTSHSVDLSTLSAGFYNIRVSGVTASGAPTSKISSVTL